MTTETKMTDARELLNRARPFLLDEATKYEDDGSNEPLELARDIEIFLATPPELMTEGDKTAAQSRMIDELTAPASDDRICSVCDGGPGNDGPCLCGERRWEQPAACDMGALCIGCEPRNADGSCPGQQPAACGTCEPDGVFDTEGNGPFDCYACGKKAQQPAAVDEASECPDCLNDGCACDTCNPYPGEQQPGEVDRG